MKYKARPFRPPKSCIVSAGTRRAKGKKARHTGETVAEPSNAYHTLIIGTLQRKLWQAGDTIAALIDDNSVLRVQLDMERTKWRAATRDARVVWEQAQLMVTRQEVQYLKVEPATAKAQVKTAWNQAGEMLLLYDKAIEELKEKNGGSELDVAEALVGLSASIAGDAHVKEL